MNANLQDGKIKVTGVVENVSWRERHEAQKKARAERMNDPELRAKYEARKKAKEDREKERAEAAKAKTEERVRRKVIAETYKALGIEEEYIENQKAWIAAQENANKYGTDDLSAADHLKRTKAIAAGAGKAVGADKKAKRNAVLDFLSGLAGESSFAGATTKVAGIGGSVAGAAIAGPIGAAIGAAAASMAANLIRLAVGNSKKDKMIDSNMADQADKLETLKTELADFEKNVNALIADVESMMPEIVEKYNSTKKADFNKYLSTTLSGLFEKHHLSSENAKNAIGKINPQEKPENEEEQEKPENENAEQVENETEEPANEEQSEKETEEPSQENPEAEAPNAEAPEQETQAPEVQEPAQGEEKPAQETEAPVIDEGDLSGPDEPDQSVRPTNEESTVSSISAEELAAAKDEMMADGLIERPEEKQAQIQEQIRRMEEEKAKQQELEIESKSEMGD